MTQVRSSLSAAPTVLPRHAGAGESSSKLISQPFRVCVRTPLIRQGSEDPVPHFPWTATANAERHIDSHYPTQAKGRLEWGTQHFLPVWQILGRTRWTHFRIGRFSRRAV